MIYKSPPSDFKPKFEVAICVVEHGGKILFLQRQIGKEQENEWGVPGGELDAGETSQEAIRREVQEETGIDLIPQQLIFVKTIYDRFPTFDFTCHVFHALLTSHPDVTIQPAEHQGYQWVTPQKALTMNHMIDVDYLLKSVFKDLE